MTGCDIDVVLYFYDEMDAADRERAGAHLHGCAACRQRLEELQAITAALATRPAVAAPPLGDWSAFTRRLDAAVTPVPAAPPAAAVLEKQGSSWTVRQVLALAALFALVTIGVTLAARYRGDAPSMIASAPVETAPAPGAAVPAAGEDESLRAVTAEHFERSKLVVLGLATRDPRTGADDWQYERRLAGTLLNDTRLYRMAAQDRGASDVARVMRDLETVLLEASLSDSNDRGALERVQRLITKRDLVVKMQVMAGSAGL